MPATDILSSVRAGLETTRGTGVNPTRFLEFTQFDPIQQVITIHPSEKRASLFDVYRAAPGRETNDITVQGNLSYNQAAWLGQVFVNSVPSGTGAGADKTYGFIPASTTDALKSATLEFGFDTALSASVPGTRLVYCLGSVLNLTFDKNSVDGITFSAQLHSPSGAADISSFGGAPTSIASTAASPINTQLSIDGTTIGTTPDNYGPTLSWTLTNGWSDVPGLNNVVGAQATFRSGPWAWQAVVNRYYINNNERGAYETKAVRKIRVATVGPVLGSSNYKITLDLYGVLTNAVYVKTDGLIYETLTYEPIYDVTAASSFLLTVVTAEATVT